LNALPGGVVQRAGRGPTPRRPTRTRHHWRRADRRGRFRGRRPPGNRCSRSRRDSSQLQMIPKGTGPQPGSGLTCRLQAQSKPAQQNQHDGTSLERCFLGQRALLHARAPARLPRMGPTKVRRDKGRFYQYPWRYRPGVHPCPLPVQACAGGPHGQDIVGEMKDRPPPRRGCAEGGRGRETHIHHGQAAARYGGWPPRPTMLPAS
jgi:hypothetical protein